MFIFWYFPETHGITFRIQISVKELLDTDVLLKLLFHLPVNYPSTLPDISVNSDQLTRAQCMDVKDKLLEQAKKHLSEPMVHDLILWIQQHLKYVIKQSATVCKEKTALSKGTSTEDGIWMLFLHLDHMRAKAKYVKTVEKWASDLRLTGRLMFMGKIILILLQGDRSNIKVQKQWMLTSSIDLPLKRIVWIFCVCFSKINNFGSRLIIRRVGRPNNFILYLRKIRYSMRKKPVIPVDLWPVLLCFPL